jgi:hypothetical protein
MAGVGWRQPPDVGISLSSDVLSFATGGDYVL